MSRKKHRALRKIVLEAFNVGVNSVTPEALFQDKVSFTEGKLQISNMTLPLDRFRRVLVIGGGKASGGMAQQLSKILGEKITSGVVNIPDNTQETFSGLIELNKASHPIPDERGVRGVKKMLKLTQGVSSEDLVICLVSGGGSALMPLPADGIDLNEKQKVTELLLKAGANIYELNTVRKHLSEVKGGRLAAKLFPATVLTIIVSDVAGDDVSTVASGLTVPDVTTFSDAKNVLEKYRLWDNVPGTVRNVIKNGIAERRSDTPKPRGAIFAKVHNVIVANNRTACSAAEDFLRRNGFSTLFLTSTVEGEAQEVGKVLASILREIRNSGQPLRPPAAVICGGETTVKVKGRGRGGRNQELVLSAAISLRGMRDVVLAAIGTDGIDGFTDAAGAITDGDTLSRASKVGLKPSAYLEDNNSYAFFSKLDDLIKTGPTGTNVNDLIIGLVGN